MAPEHVTFRVEATQYGDLVFRLPDGATSGGSPAIGLALEVQLVITPDFIEAFSETPSGIPLLQPLSTTREHLTTYQVTGRIERVGKFVETDGSLIVEIHEILLRPKVPILVRIGQTEGTREKVWNTGDTIKATGTLWGLVSWVDGALFEPTKGYLVELSELPIGPGSTAREAVMRLEISDHVSPANRISWIQP